jgi:hypothetical protein
MTVDQRVGAGVRSRAVLTAAIVAIALAGCSAAATPPLGLDDVVAERAAAREAPERQRFAAFVERSSDRLIDLGLAVPQFQGMITLDDWADTMVTCVSQSAPTLDIVPTDDGYTVNYFGVVGDDYERSQLTLESCKAQYGVDDPAVELLPGAVEAAWRYQDATQRVLPCLRHIGAAAPSPPNLVAFREDLGTGREWSPYALVVDDQATLARALALCPPSASVVQAHIALLDDAPTTTGLTPPRGSSLVP